MALFIPIPKTYGIEKSESENIPEIYDIAAGTLSDLKKIQAKSVRLNVAAIWKNSLIEGNIFL